MGDVGVLSFDITFIHEMIFNWLCVGGVSVVLYRFLYNPVNRLLTERRERLRESYERAESCRKEAEELKAEYTRRLGEIRLEREEILDTAAKRASQREEIIIKAAKNEAKSIICCAKSDAELAKMQARLEIRQEIIEVSAAMAEKILMESLDNGFTREILDKSMSELEAAKWPVLEKLAE